MAAGFITAASTQAEAVRIRIRSSSSSSIPWWFYLIFAVLLFIIAGASTASVKKSSAKKKMKQGPKDYTAQIVNEMVMLDPEFGSESMTTRAKENFATLTEAITNRDPSPLQSIESQELFDRHNSEIQALISQGQLRMISGIHILKTFLHLYRRDKNYEYLTVCITTYIKDCIVDQNDNRLIQGDRDKILVKHYLMTYMRNKELRSGPPQQQQEQQKIIKCPNCGAPIDISNSRLCEYCHSIIHIEQYGWVLYNVEILGENDTPDNRGILIEDNSDVRFTRQNGPFYTGYFDNGIEDKYRDPFEDDDYNKNF